jgi:signal transduction histidine kinase
MAKKVKDKGFKPSFLVGIGASAGSLKAIEKFFSHIPSGSGLSYVVIQNLSSRQKSVIGPVAKQYAKMKAMQIKNGMKIRSDRIYFSPPHKDVAVMDGTLYLMVPAEIKGARMPINFFLRSLAESYRERAICIFLSGTGPDGASGMKAVKEAGGLVMAQAAKQAHFSGMLESAVGTKIVDYILPIYKMPDVLLQYVRYVHAVNEKNFISDRGEFNSYLQKILTFIPPKTGQSLSDYKQQAVRRGIERRMAIQHIGGIKDYFHYLQQHPSEIDVLFKDLTIMLTGFFRDPEARLIEEELKIYRVHLEQLIKNRTTELTRANMRLRQEIKNRQQAEKELRESQKQLRGLATHLEFVREEERSRIALDIHDELGQSLTALKMDLSWLRKRLQKGQEALSEKAAAMSGLIDTTVRKVQRIASDLRPGLLDDLGLVSAIEWQTKDFQDRAGIECRISADLKNIMLDKDRSTAVFRVFQETLTNIARHADATEVEVNLNATPDELFLEVKDNGKGITSGEINDPLSFGLMGIRERVNFWGGRVNIRGIKNKGTKVTVSIPVR